MANSSKLPRLALRARLASALLVGSTARPENPLATVRARTSETCPDDPPHFEVTVVEDDTNDTILQDWWVDRDEPGREPTNIRGDSLQSNGESTRIASSPDALWSKLRGFSGDTLKHRVEVFITDGNFGSTVGTVDTTSATNSIPLPDGGKIYDAVYYDSFVWLAEVKDCGSK